MTSAQQAIGNQLAPRWFQFRQLLNLGAKSGWMALMFWLVAILPVRAGELELRVAVQQNVNQVTVGSSTGAMLKDEAGRVLAEVPAMGALVVNARSGRLSADRWQASQLWLEPNNDGFVYIGDKWYRGRTKVVPTNNGLTAVNYVDLEDYLYSVVASEMPPSWHIEALKAQAVAARSYALYQRQSSANAVFDVGNTTTWQVYDGVAKETTSTQAAVDATRGQVLVYNGQIINAVFHSSSGGHTENVEDVWSNPLPYLRGVPDFDQGASVYQWSANFTADQLRQRITGIGNILSFVPERTTPRGRIRSMRVVGDAGSKVLTGNEFRQALGLRSSLVAEIVPTMGRVASAGNVASAPTAFQFTGRGFGHGLGMSQWGAFGMAQRGQGYQQIVLHYYTNASLARIQVR